MAQPGSNSKGVLPVPRTGQVSFWRVEGSLLELGAMRPVGFFTWNPVDQLIQDPILHVRYNDLKFIVGFRQMQLTYIRRAE